MQSLIISAAVLIIAIIMSVIGSRAHKSSKFTKNLKEIVPHSDTIGDWSVTYRPISETAEVKAMVDELINYDDAVYVRFTRNDWWIDVYIAYWNPGKMSYRAIAGHTPDVCWVGQGWNCQLRTVVKIIPENRTAIQGLQMQHRIYTLSGEVVHVIFCHIVDGELLSYQTADGIPPWHSMFTDLWKRGLWQKKEQSFLRISSNRVLDDLRKVPPVRKLLAQYAEAFTVNDRLQTDKDRGR